MRVLLREVTRLDRTSAYDATPDMSARASTWDRWAGRACDPRSKHSAILAAAEADQPGAGVVQVKLAERALDVAVAACTHWREHKPHAGHFTSAILAGPQAPARPLSHFGRAHRLGWLAGSKTRLCREQPAGVLQRCSRLGTGAEQARSPRFHFVFASCFLRVLFVFSPCLALAATSAAPPSTIRRRSPGLIHFRRAVYPAGAQPTVALASSRNRG